MNLESVSQVVRGETSEYEAKPSKWPTWEGRYTVRAIQSAFGRSEAAKGRGIDR